MIVHYVNKAKEIQWIQMICVRIIGKVCVCYMEMSTINQLHPY